MGELVAACKDGDVDKVKQLLDNKANINEMDVRFLFFIIVIIF